MPIEHGLVGQRRRKIPVEIDHHLGDAAFGGRHARSFIAQAELLTQRRLHAVAVQDFTFDFGGFDSLFADKLDFQRFLVVRANMFTGADELPGLQ